MRELKNKNGWGLSTELGFILLFIICIIVSIIFTNKFGFIGTLNSDLNPGVDLREDYVTYDNLEGKMIEGAKKYVNETYMNNIGEDTLIIRVSHLVKNNYLSTLMDKNGSKCSGYIEVKNISNNSITYIPYLKCDDYKTSGYQRRNDW